MEILVSAFDEKKILHSLICTTYSNNIEINLQNYNEVYNFSYEHFDNMMQDYYRNYGLNGKSYIERVLLKELKLLNKSNLDIEIARVFAISTQFMHISNQKDFTNRSIYYDSIKESSNTFLNDFNIIDWSGDLGPQPGIYFLKKEYIDKYSKAIEKFYQLGLLFKFSLKFENEHFYNYIYPFVDNKIRNFEILNYLNVWKQIENDRNEELLRFINGKRR
jgi:hypothetical protein